jgi:hypothetical protein
MAFETLLSVLAYSLAASLTRRVAFSMSGTVRVFTATNTESEPKNKQITILRNAFNDNRQAVHYGRGQEYGRCAYLIYIFLPEIAWEVIGDLDSPDSIGNSI